MKKYAKHGRRARDFVKNIFVSLIFKNNLIYTI